VSSEHPLGIDRILQKRRPADKSLFTKTGRKHERACACVHCVCSVVLCMMMMMMMSIDGTSVTWIIGGTVVGMLVLTTVLVVVIMFVQRRHNARNHRRAVVLQIREDLFRDNRADDAARPRPVYVHEYHRHHHHRRHRSDHRDHGGHERATPDESRELPGNAKSVRLTIPDQ